MGDHEIDTTAAERTTTRTVAARRARAVLAARGLDEAELRSAGFDVGPDGALHAPVRDADGRQVSVRRYADATHGARPRGDLGAPAWNDPALPDPRWGRLEWRGVFAVQHHVARPPPGTPPPALPDVGALLVDDEFGAELAARRLGLPAVAPSDLGLISDAAFLAAELAGTGRTLVALSRSPATDADLARGVRFAQCAAAIETAGGRPVLLALPPRGSLERQLQLRRPLRLRPLNHERVRLDGWTRAPVVALGVAAWWWRRLLASIRARRATVLARRGVPALRPLDADPDVRTANLRAAAEIQALAGECGAELLVHGGVGVDLMLGAPLRERKDVDMVMTRGGPAEAALLIRAAEARGFDTWLDLPGSYFALRRGPALVDVWQSRAADDGRHIFARNVFMRLSPPFEDDVERVIDGTALRMLHPHYVLALKERQMREVKTWFPRWSISGEPEVIDDVAALRAALQAAGDPHRFRQVDAGRSECRSLTPDPGPATLSQLREFVDVHLRKRRVR